MEERKIRVYDKNDQLLAVFSNNTPAHIDEEEKELMISPTVDIESNGSSTLSFQMFVSSRKWQQIKHPENIYKLDNGRVYTALNEKSVTQQGPIVNVTLVELWYLLSQKYVQVHNVDTKLESLDDHTVKILPKTDPKFKLTVNGTAYDDSEVVDSRGVQMPRGSAGYALWGLLKGTDWKLGVCDVLPDNFSAKDDYGTFNIESDMKSVLENIQFVQELYGGILDWDSGNKILHLRDERKEGTDFNTWKGFSIRKGKNLSEYPTVEWDYNITTRLYPLGNGNLNIKRVNDDKGYVENFSYTDKVYEGYIQNSNIYDTNDEGGQKTLKFWAEQKLEKLCRPRKSISYNIEDMRDTEQYRHETFDINDIVKAYYEDGEDGGEVFEYLRIYHLSYNYFFPGNDSVVEVGDKVANEVELFYQIYKDNQNDIKPGNDGKLPGDLIEVWLPEDYWEEAIEAGFFNGGYASLQYITQLHAEHYTENTAAISDLRVYADDTFATITSFTDFQQKTEDGFKESYTRIDQVSTALSAQIELEASHHEQSLKYTQDSIAGLKLYVDGEFSQVLLAAAYRYTDNEVGDVSDALAEFESYADRHFATVSMLAKYTTESEVDDMIRSSEASIKAYADKHYASVSIESTVDEFSTVFRVTAYGVSCYGNMTITEGATIGGACFIGGRRCNWIRFGDVSDSARVMVGGS